MAIAELHPSSLGSLVGELIKTLEDCGDQANAQLLRDLRQKFECRETTVACCGYVSAGKSRLINLLIGDVGLLPVSPLPTSQNTVWLRAGKQTNLTVRYKDKHYTTTSMPELVEFHKLCEDDGLDSLELSWPTPQGISFIDTPGIDSLETGAQLASNPALLMADLVIYVTDYNHVQSQVNFSFLRTLQTRKIPYLLVVNQIDKHVGLELSLPEFRAKLQQALAQWDLNPLQLYFINLMGNKHPECQLEQLSQTLVELRDSGPALLEASLIRSVKLVLHSHDEFFSAQQDVLKQPHVWALEQAILEPEAIEHCQQLEKRLAELTSQPEKLTAAALTELDKLLENAPLFSFETRQLAQGFLESRQPGFKAGLFASKARTLAEQEQRRARLYAELTTRAEANLTWHVRKLLADIPARYNLPDDKFREQAAELTIHFGLELLEQTLRPGAVVAGDYVMNYTHDLAAAIKRVYRQSSLPWIERARVAATQKVEQEVTGLHEQLVYYLRLCEAFARLNKLDTLRNTYMAKLLRPWEQMVCESSINGLRVDHNSRDTVVREQNKPKSVKPAFPGPATHGLSPVVRAVHPKLWQTAQKLIACSKLIKPLAGFNLAVQALEQRAERLEHNLFTVALFGAFSAGKSSLANALLGENILPVSPNPTTAAINKILPPTDQCPHGTIKIKLKTPEDLTADVIASLAVFGLTAPDLVTALCQLPVLDAQAAPLEARPHLSFLQAVARGQAGLLESLGQELSVEFKDFRDFVVQEDKACFVEWIEVYYACPLTEIGVVLVDTPGSNSTNARHTNVAFDYIKNADAVLFVTYYNNPFCKADAQFLAQLGKVKDTFAMDKMFFLVNAADLAETQAELAQVLKHVEQNLSSCDIIRPRIFPVSSQLALLAKLDSARSLQPETEQLYRQRLKLSLAAGLPAPDKALTVSGLKQFETSFYSFIEEELINLALESAEKDLRGILLRVEGLLDAAATDSAQRENKLMHYRVLEQKIQAAVENSTVLAEERSISQEIDELFYYVQQRIMHRFGDLFNRSFYVLSQPKDEQPKLAVQQCIRELLQDLEVELAQETRATGLRVEKFVQKSLNSVSDKLNELVKQLDPQCRLQAEREFSLTTEPVIADPVWNSGGLAKVSSIYKSPKDWLEGQGRNKMREALLGLVQPEVHDLLGKESHTFKELWGQLFQSQVIKLHAQIKAEIKDYYAAMTAALGTGYDIIYLEHVRQQLARLTRASD